MSRLSVILGWAAMLIFTFYACTHMVAAGDTWVAMACGRHFVNHGVDTVEPFSAHSHKAGPTEEEVKNWPSWARWIVDKVGLETVKYWHPTGWINQNWLTHVIFYSLVPKSTYADGVSFSSNALVYWKFAVYIVTVVCVYYTGRLLGAHTALCAVFSCFAMLIGRSFIDIRPAGFSNMLVAVFLLILVLATYRNILYIWLIVPVTVFWCNVHGGYIYVFIMLVPFVGLNFLTSFSKGKFRSVGLKGVYHTIAAGFVTLLAVIVFNPFHLTNLTHTFIISVSKHAERWRDIHEWKSAFDWDNPVGTAIPFMVMYILAWLALAGWGAVMTAAPGTVTRYRKRKTKRGDQYEWPKVDLAVMVIAALTIYMAIRSRRFIPIAAVIACPVIAMLIDQAIRAVAATLTLIKENRLAVPPMPRDLQLAINVVGAGVVLFLGTWWSLKFKTVYLDEWPADPNLSSVFMRMTASDAKPFYAMKFIRDNKLAGNMFNYWTEGGFIAWGQDPDPETGRTPLRLFMDGRAQAAYDRRAFDNWSYIMAGGPITYQIMERSRAREENLTREDYEQIGQWMDEHLRADPNNVWAVLMPAVVFGSSKDKPSYHAIKSLEYHPNWRLVFYNNRQKLFVDITTPQGQKLFDGISDGTTLYPDDFHKNLICAHTWLMHRTGLVDRMKGFDFAVRAFELNPSPTPMMEILTFANFAELKPNVDKVCEIFFRQYSENRDKWSRQDGYRLKTLAAQLACYHLRYAARSRGDRKLEEFYAEKEAECFGELTRISENKRW